jgi:hypothetical protein
MSVLEYREQVPPETASQLYGWMEMAVNQNPEAYAFAGETGQPLWRFSLLRGQPPILACHIRSDIGRKTRTQQFLHFHVAHPSTICIL